MRTSSTIGEFISMDVATNVVKCESTVRKQMAVLDFFVLGVHVAWYPLEPDEVGGHNINGGVHEIPDKG